MEKKTTFYLRVILRRYLCNVRVSRKAHFQTAPVPGLSGTFELCPCRMFARRAPIAAAKKSPRLPRQSGTNIYSPTERCKKRTAGYDGRVVCRLVGEQ